MFWIAIAIIAVAAWFFKSPLAQASADAIRHVNGVPVRNLRTEEGLARVTEDLEALREQMNELAERVDFAERALADVRRREAIQPPRT